MTDDTLGRDIVDAELDRAGERLDRHDPYRFYDNRGLIRNFEATMKKKRGADLPEALEILLARSPAVRQYLIREIDRADRGEVD